MKVEVPLNGFELSVPDIFARTVFIKLIFKVISVFYHVVLKLNKRLENHTLCHMCNFRV